MDGYGQIQIDIEDRQRSVWKEIDRYRYRYRQMQTDLDRYRKKQIDANIDANIHEYLDIDRYR